VQGWRITGAGRVVLAMNSFAGRTMSTMSEGERTDFFRRMYQPKRRWPD
jgi:acetylornithine/succinyldiaminopimelate/putrescine aminotransferase